MIFKMNYREKCVPKFSIQQYALLPGAGLRTARARTCRTWSTHRTGRSTGTSVCKVIFTVNSKFFSGYDENLENEICSALNRYYLAINPSRNVCMHMYMYNVYIFIYKFYMPRAYILQKDYLAIKVMQS